MSRFIFRFVFQTVMMSMASIAFADDKIYLNERFEITSAPSAAYYAVADGERDGLFGLKVHYLSGSLRMRGQYTDKEYTTEEGFFEYLYINGKVESSGYFSEGRKVGPWARYNWDGSRKPDRIYFGEYVRYKEDPNRIQPAAFPGNDEALFDFLAKQINPKNCGTFTTKNQVVHIGFKVKATGEVADLYVAKSVNPELDAEAMRVVGLMPAWIPAMKQGVPVESIFILPVAFAINL